MPVTLPLVSRRQFLSWSVAAAGYCVVRPTFALEEKRDPHRIALLSDTHIPDDPSVRAQVKWDMTANFRNVIGQVAKLTPAPACNIITGDLAYKSGTAEEYRAFSGLASDLSKVGSTHLALGNHDNHPNFRAAYQDLFANKPPVENKYVQVIELPRANLFILDSLHENLGSSGGKFGAEQLKWLTTALDERKDKPALILGHHHFDEKPDAMGKYGGLADTTEFWALIKDRKQVKAYFYGHTHVWKLEVREGVHLINLPAVGYSFNAGEIVGWTDAHLTEDGISLKLQAHDVEHKLHNSVHPLKWRA